MRKIRLIAVPTLLVTFILAIAGTTAAAPNVPPGVSGANQYTETLPGPGGNGPTGGGASLSSGGGTSAPKAAAETLGAANARKLEALGPDGKAAAELATETTPAGSSVEKSVHKDGKHAVQTTGREAGSSNPAGSSSSKGSSGIQQVLGQITGTGGSDSGGMSWLLPLLIGASVVVAAAYLFARHGPPRPQD